MRRATLCASLLFVIATPTWAQFWESLTKPQVNVTITHPAGLGLKLSKVAFGPTKGQCADEFLDSLVELLVQNNVEVIDRQNLESVLAEHKFTLSGYVDKQSATQLGKILGPAALVFVKVQRCNTEQKALYEKQSDYKGNVWYVNISRTQTFFKASVQTVDLATGRVFAARTLEHSPMKENRSAENRPEFPPESEVHDLALRAAQEEVRKLLFPWNETRQLYFYNDRECDMTQAFNLIKSGQHQASFDQSLKNLETCKAATSLKPKFLGHAYYNVGMGYFVTSDFGRAIGMFREAQKINPGNIVDQSISDSVAAMALYAELQKQETAAAAQLGGNDAGGSPARSSRTTSQASPSSGGASTSLEDRLKKLEELKKKGLITEEEYKKKKAAILADL